MGFNEIVQKGATKYDVLVDFGTFKWSMNGVDTDSGHYEDRITSFGQIRRFVDPGAAGFDISNINLEVSNFDDPANVESNTGFFTSDIDNGLMTRVDVTVQVRVVDLFTDEVATKTIYAGVGDLAPGRNERIVRLTITPAIFHKLGPIQHMITKTRFPNANEKYLGVGMPLSYGSGYDSQDAARRIELPQVDTVNQDIAVTQILVAPGAAASANDFDLFYTEEAGGGTPTSLGTKTSVADVDEFGEEYRRFRLVGGDWLATRKYFTPRLPFRSDVDKPFYPLDDIQDLIVSESFKLVSGDIDATSFSDTAQFLTWIWGTDAYAGSGFSIPTSGAPSMEVSAGKTTGWDIVSEMFASLGANGYINYSGQIAVVMILPWPVTNVNTSTIVDKDDPVAIYRREDGDIEEISITDAAWGIVNDLRASSDNKGLTAPGARVDSERFQNADSVTRYGTEIEELTVKGINFFGQNAADERTSGRVVLGEHYMKLRSGAYKQIDITIGGRQGLIPEIGEIITVSDQRTIGVDKDLQVIGITFNPQVGDVVISAINIDDPFGTITSIEPGGQFGLELGADLDMYVDDNFPTTSFGTATTIKHGHIDGGLTGAERMALRFDLTTVDSAGGTIISAELDLNLQSWIDPSAIWLTELTATSWTLAQHFDNFNGTGWTESFIGSDIAPQNLGVSVGIKTFVLNAAGLTFLNAQLGSGNRANITFRGMNEDEHYIFSSSRDANVASRPKLRLVYTT